MAESGIEFQFEGANRVANWLRGLAVKLPHAVSEESEAWGKEARTTLKSEPYPAAPAKSRYKRTGQLANRWALDKRGDGVFAITNKARDRRGRFYAGYVVGDAEGNGQAQVHRNRWWLFKSVIARLLPNLRRRIAARISREVA